MLARARRVCRVRVVARALPALALALAPTCRHLHRRLRPIGTRPAYLRWTKVILIYYTTASTRSSNSSTHPSRHLHVPVGAVPRRVPGTGSQSRAAGPPVPACPCHCHCHYHCQCPPPSALVVATPLSSHVHLLLFLHPSAYVLLHAPYMASVPPSVAPLDKVAAGLPGSPRCTPHPATPHTQLRPRQTHAPRWNSPKPFAMCSRQPACGAACALRDAGPLRLQLPRHRFRVADVSGLATNGAGACVAKPHLISHIHLHR